MGTTETAAEPLALSEVEQMVERFHADGFAHVPAVLAKAEVEALIAENVADPCRSGAEGEASTWISTS